MADLRASFCSLGHTDVTTYIQSGNVIFRSRSTDTARLVTGLEAQLAAAFGSSPAVILRTVPDLLRIGMASPYAERGADPARHHVTFLAQTPSRERVHALSLPESGGDELVLSGAEVYVHTPDGYAHTRLTGTFLERHLGVLSTTRNWNAVTKLCALLRNR